ncbi:MAG: 16S rRNA (guanine(966)-N(2))-methyltransferase RsmD [Oscillospiraceae bacterium]|jgi:16S rRNA (guanine(966)-N(2))-methyltransferase RsmD|nr:16S rRNA (guanine(966)-N(2))-methyltransferase RsmD [Oscillospiraceae bacterium]
MRVISGTARGRRLHEPSGRGVRPTADRVKEAMFNIIQLRVENRRVLDLFSGTGQLGIEALSRGARGAVFVDASPESVRLTRENVELSGVSGLEAVVRRDSIAYLGEGCGRFGLIFLDPPFDTALLRESLDKIMKFDILEENGIIVCESRSDAPAPDARDPYYIASGHKYGGTKLTLYSRMAMHTQED